MHVPLAESREVAASRTTRARRTLFLPRFGLRALLVVALIGSVGMAVLGRRFYAMRQEAAAVEGLLDAGATINFDYQRGEDGFFAHDDEPPPDPYGLNGYLGEQFFAKANVVRLHSNAAAKRAHVTLLPHLSDLEQAALNGPTFGDESIEPLGRCENLRYLQLANARVTGEGLARLANRERIETFSYRGGGDFRNGAPRDAGDSLSGVDRLSNLKTCYVSSTYLTKSQGQAIARLEKLETLEFIALEGMEPGALDAFGELDTVRTLVFSNAQDVPLCDADLAAIGGMERLEVLGFDGEQVTDEGIRQLAQLRHLRELSASMPSITDAGVAALANVTTLKTLYLPDSPITDAGLDALDGLPNLELVGVATTVSRERARRFSRDGRSVRRYESIFYTVDRYTDSEDESSDWGRSERSVPFLQ